MAQIQWPAGKKAAIMLTYDDGCHTQWENVVPALNEHGFKGTFFLMGCYLTEQDIPQWRRVSQQGHELGNHTIYHACNDSKADTFRYRFFLPAGNYKVTFRNFDDELVFRVTL